VERDEKSRYTLETRDGVLMVRANQGHSIKHIDDSSMLRAVASAAELPICYHGTSAGVLPLVLRPGGGLSRMTRRHVHFATAPVGEARSGVRGSAVALIDLDVPLALAAGASVWLSDNSVALSAGLPPAAAAAGDAVLADLPAGSEVPPETLAAAAAAARPLVPASASAPASGSVGGSGSSRGSAAAAEVAASGAGSAEEDGWRLPWWLLSSVRRRSDDAVVWRRGWPLPVGLAPGKGAPAEAVTAAMEAAASRRAGARAAAASSATAASDAGGDKGGAARPARKRRGAPGARRAASDGPGDAARGGAGPASSAGPGECSAAGSAGRFPDVYIVLDFEATCVRGGRLSPQEVIELPSVALDARTGAVLSEFRSYVRPLHHPRLSEFCTELTGIEQPTVDAAPAWPEACAAWEAWVSEQGWTPAVGGAASSAEPAGAGPGAPEDSMSPAASFDWSFSGEGAVSGTSSAGTSRTRLRRPGTAVLVTCGDWDIKTMLPAQAAASPAAPVPQLMRSWINIKRTVAGRHGAAAARGMPSMLKFAGLPQRGRHHSGLDDCRNIGAVLSFLIGRGQAPTLSEARTVRLRRS